MGYPRQDTRDTYWLLSFGLSSADLPLSLRSGFSTGDLADGADCTLGTCADDINLICHELENGKLDEEPGR